MFMIDVGPTAPSEKNWTNSTLGPLGPGAYQAGLQDFGVRGQPKGEFVFAAYISPSTTPTIRGMYNGVYKAAAPIEWTPLLLPLDFANIDVDAADADAGLLIAVTPPPSFQYDGVLLLRGPIVGVGRSDGITLTPTIMPWPTGVPVALRSSSIQQLDFQPPNRLVIAWGRLGCISDELWETTLTTSSSATAPMQIVASLLAYSQLQSTSSGDGGSDLAWVKCSARVVLAHVKEESAVDQPLDYADLGHAWLDIDIGSTSTSMRTMARVGTDFIFGYSTGAVFHAVLVADGGTDYHFEKHVLLSNDSAWLPTSSTVSGTRIFLGEQNATGSNGRIRTLSFPSPGVTPSLSIFVRDAVSVSDLGVSPATCIPDVPALYPQAAATF
jgi:hypothetical protein